MPPLTVIRFASLHPLSLPVQGRKEQGRDGAVGVAEPSVANRVERERFVGSVDFGVV